MHVSRTFCYHQLVCNKNRTIFSIRMKIDSHHYWLTWWIYTNNQLNVEFITGEGCGPTSDFCTDVGVIRGSQWIPLGYEYHNFRIIKEQKFVIKFNLCEVKKLGKAFSISWNHAARINWLGICASWLSVEKKKKVIRGFNSNPSDPLNGILVVQSNRCYAETMKNQKWTL